jgi:hypothetical protein
MKEETRKEPTQYALRMEKRRLASAARVQDLLDKADKAQQEREDASLLRQREKAAIERELAKITQPADKAQFAVHKKLVLQATAKNKAGKAVGEWTDLDARHYGQTVKNGLEMAMWAKYKGSSGHAHRIVERTDVVLVMPGELRWKK